MHDMQAFSSRLFYNGETGFFEQVHGEAWTAEEDKITPSSSLATLYLTDEVVGPVSPSHGSLYFDIMRL